MTQNFKHEVTAYNKADEENIRSDELVTDFSSCFEAPDLKIYTVLLTFSLFIELESVNTNRLKRNFQNAPH